MKSTQEDEKEEGNNKPNIDTIVRILPPTPPSQSEDIESEQVVFSNYESVVDDYDNTDNSDSVNAHLSTPVALHSFPHDIVFDPKNQNERTPWTIFGYDCSRSLLIFMFQYILVCTLVISSLISLINSKSCEQTTLWVAILGSAVGYILPCPSL